MPERLEYITFAVAWLLIAGIGGTFWLILLQLAPSSRPLFPRQRCRALVWTGSLVFAAFLAAYLLPSIIAGFVPRHALLWFLAGPYAEKLKDTQSRTIVFAGIELLSLPAIIAAWLCLWNASGGRGPAFGVVPRRIAVDIGVGFLAWLVVTLPVYAIQFAALVIYALVVGQAPAAHPIIQTLESGPAPVGVILVFVAQAVVSAPIKEELFFRGIIQPWLYDRPWGGAVGLCLAAMAGALMRLPASGIGNPGDFALVSMPVVFVLALLPLYWLLGRADLRRWIPVRDPISRRQAARGIFATALLFANVHAAVWPTPIPLFVFALALGWLAYRTQGVVAPIVLHALFNAIVVTEIAVQPWLVRLL